MAAQHDRARRIRAEPGSKQILCLDASTHADCNAEAHVGLLSLPSRSANMKEGALLSVVSRSMNALGWPATPEPGSSSSIPPAWSTPTDRQLRSGFRACHLQVRVVPIILNQGLSLPLSGCLTGQSHR